MVEVEMALGVDDARRRQWADPVRTADAWARRKTQFEPSVTGLDTVFIVALFHHGLAMMASIQYSITVVAAAALTLTLLPHIHQGKKRPRRASCFETSGMVSHFRRHVSWCLGCVRCQLSSPRGCGLPCHVVNYDEGRSKVRVRGSWKRNNLKIEQP